MKKNMTKWVQEYMNASVKKPMPILSFPGVVMMDKTVEELVKDGYLQAACMKKIADEFDAGAAFSLMDLSVEAEAFGCSVVYSKDEVPTIQGVLIRESEEAEELKAPEVGAGRTGVCVEGIREACKRIENKPVFAGMIGPFSLVGRMTDMTKIMYLCFDEPDMVNCLLEKATDFLIQYALAFKGAGASGICMAEPVAGLLSPNLFNEFSKPYVEKICKAVEDDSFLVIYHNCGNIRPLLSEIGKMEVRAYSIGNTIDMRLALEKLPEDALVLGNVDPARVMRNGTPEIVHNETLKVLEQCSKYKNFVLSTGCDVPPLSPRENIQAFFDTAEEFYRE